MPMNHRLLVPRRGGHVFQDADARTYALAVEAADNAKLERLVAKAIDDLVIGLKADSNWTPLGAAVLLAGPRTLAGALVPLVGPAPSNNGPFVSADYARKTGLIGNASTKYLDTNYAGNTPGQDDCSFGAWVSTASSVASSYIGAGLTVTGATNLGVLSPNLNARNRTATGDALASMSGATGLIGSSRSGSAGYIVRAGGGNNTITRASETPASATFHVFKANGSSAYGNGRIAFYWAGTAVTLSQIDARLTTYIADIAAAIP